MKVAVIGSGVSGLAATWVSSQCPFNVVHILMREACQVLNEYSDHEVHVYEVDDRPGGHANTAAFTAPSGASTSVDT